MKTLTCPPALSLHARTTSLCHSQLHALHHHACAGFPLLVCFLFSFSANSLFFSPLTTLLQHHNRDRDTTHGMTTAPATPRAAQQQHLSPLLDRSPLSR